MGPIDIALAALNYSRICHIYNIYSSINRGVNKKEGTVSDSVNRDISTAGGSRKSVQLDCL